MMKNIVAGGFSSIEQAAGSIQRKNRPEGKESSAAGVSFQEVLRQRRSIEEALEETGGTAALKFSKHADARLQQREITLTEEQLSRLAEGTHKAGSKGIKESLVLLDNMAFIVNTQNNTVVTAMDQNMNEENIYTNIDGAVII